MALMALDPPPWRLPVSQAVRRSHPPDLKPPWDEMTGPGGLRKRRRCSIGDEIRCDLLLAITLPPPIESNAGG